MNRSHEIALKHHCRLAAETTNPKFKRLLPGDQVTVIITVNSGYE